MTTSNRDSGFSDAVAALVVIVPLVWFFASVGLGMLKDQMEGPGSREEEGATAGRSASKGRSPRFTPPPVAKPLAVRIHEGREAYNVNCASCHQPGAVGKVGFAPDIHNPDFLSIATDDFLRQTIREGRPGTAMAPWKHLTEDQVTGIIAYLRAEGGSAVKPVRLDPNRRVPGEPSEGEPLFAAYCGSCHGPKGEGYIAGGAGPGIGLPGFLKAASDDFIVHTLEVGRRGTPMKSFKGAGGLANLSGDEIGHVVAYMRALGEHASLASTSTAAADRVADPVHGEQQYNINCAACHQPEGTGMVGFAPSIRNRDFLALASDDFIKQTIREGRPGTPMVARADLSDAILDDIIAYLRSVEVATPIEITLDEDKTYHGDSDAGANKYSTFCASCHGAKGDGYVSGGTGPAIGLPGFLSAASDDYIYQTLKLGRIGTAMKPFLGARGVANLTDEDASDIITYLRTLNP